MKTFMTRRRAVCAGLVGLSGSINAVTFILVTRSYGDGNFLAISLLAAAGGLLGGAVSGGLLANFFGRPRAVGWLISFLASSGATVLGGMIGGMVLVTMLGPLPPVAGTVIGVLLMMSLLAFPLLGATWLLSWTGTHLAMRRL